MTRQATCHPSLPLYAKGLCKRCYDRLAQRTYRLRRKLLKAIRKAS